MSQQIINLKGFRDFLPYQKRQRNFVAKKLSEVFEKFGFEPIETPTLENAQLLMGKYGEEADRLIYKFQDRGERYVALRYDQTVPSSRYLVQYANELPKFFRRYQIQNVFRADKPQKGRYREFTQCDIDIYGSQSFLTDAEIVACTYFAFKNVGFKEVRIKINDRKVLIENLSKYVNDKVDVYSIIQSIDKLDKQTEEEVCSELIEKGLTKENAQAALDSINQAAISQDISKVIEAAVELGVSRESLVFTPTLARGLDYYTGVMYEVIIPDYKVGSCAGGGRYDTLLKKLTGQDIPATGLAFGFDRIIDAAIDLNVLPNFSQNMKVLMTTFDESTLKVNMNIAAKLREKNISVELFPENSNDLGKQLKYADKNNFEIVLIAGQSEVEKSEVKVKFMKSGEEKIVPIAQIDVFIEGLL